MARIADPAQELTRLERGDGELLIVAAHPDDDVIGAGALMARVPRARVLYVTDGAPRDGQDARAHGFAGVTDYAAARRREAEAALALAGMGPERADWLEIADQQATFALERVIGALLERIGRATAVVLTHPYEGGHPDHDATAFAVHAALALSRGTAAPALLEFGGYRAGAGGGRTTEFLADGGAPPFTRELSEGDQRVKAAMFACHGSQRAVLSMFSCARERFRVAPRYDFSRAPHDGPLLYERPGSGAEWGLEGASWRAEAAAVRRRLGLG